VKRGEIYWADLAPRSGAEQRGRRPVVVVSHDGFNQVPGWRSVIVVPLTTKARRQRAGPTAVPLPKGTGGLTKASTALAHQITTIDRAKLGRRVGALDGESLGQLEQAIRAAAGID
jgi:mRNA interferase MazF